MINGRFLLSFLKRSVLVLVRDELVRGAYDLLGGVEFLDSVRAPARNTRDREEGSVHLDGDVEHTVNETGIEVHVCTHRLVRALEGIEEIGSDTLDRLKQCEVVGVALLFCEIVGVLLEHLRTGVGERVYRVSHTVDESRAVAKLLLENSCQHLAKLCLVVRVLHIFLDAVEHLLNLDVRTAVERALERADRACDSRIGVGARGRENSAGEGGVVTAAVLCLNDHTDVKQSCLFLGVLLGRAEHTKEVLRGADIVVRTVEVKASAVVVCAVVSVGMRRDDGELCDYLDALTEHILKACVIGVFVVGIERKHAGRHLVHYRARGRFHKDVLRKSRGELAVVREERVEIVELLFVGELAEEEKVNYLLEAVAVFLSVAVDELGHIEAAVFELTVVGNLVTLVNVVSVNVTYSRNARHNAGAVLFAQTSLDSVVFKCGRRNAVCLLCFLKTACKKLVVEIGRIVGHGRVNVVIHKNSPSPQGKGVREVTSPKKKCPV